MLTLLDAPAVRLWAAAVMHGLEEHRAEIDELNVYPVPDGDTGTNMALTAQAAAHALHASPAADPKGCLGAFARGAVLGARGNSGVILSQILRGLADACPDGPVPGGAVLADGLALAADLAYAAVAAPVEGTILTVARAAAEAAAPVRGQGFAEVAVAVAEAAAQALARTPSQLAALARAGVVDAGGRGLVVVLDALVAVVTGRAAEHPQALPDRRGRPVLEVARETGSADFGYEVQYLLDAGEEQVRRLRTRLAGLGDSVVVVGSGDGVWNVHVHTNDIGAAVEVGVEAGRPHRIAVTRFADQVAAAERVAAGRVPTGVVAASERVPADRVGTGTVASDEVAADGVATDGVAADGVAADGVATDAVDAGRGASGAQGGGRRGTAVVAVAPESGLSDLFRAEGVAVVCGNPSTAELLSAIETTGAAAVVVLPNSRDRTAVAVAAAEEARVAGIRVAVVPTRSPVQGLAAVAVHEASRRFDDDVVAMAETAAATRSAEITVAVRDALTMAGRCQAGDVLGLVEGEVLLIGASVREVAQEMVNRLLATGGELMTVIVGADAPEGLADLLERHLAATRPEVEMVAYDGGQPLYPVLIGVE